MRKETRQTVAYFYGIVWREKPVYFLYLILTILFTAVSPFPNIVLPRLIIEELMQGRRENVLLLSVLVLIISNFCLQSLIHICTREKYKLDSWFENYFDLKFTKRCMLMDFEHTENPEVLNQSRKAKDGMGFYSGGLLGLSDCFKEIVASVITLCGVVVIIASASPFLFVIALLAVLGGSFVVSRINRLEITVFNKGPQINRAFWYVHDILGYSRYGKDIRLYGAEKMLTRKGEECFADLYHLFKEQEDGKRKWGCLNALIAMGESMGIYLYLGYLAVMGRVSIGDFTMLVTSAVTFRTSLQNVITQLQELQKKANFMQEYLRFMEYEDAKVRGTRKLTDTLSDAVCNTGMEKTETWKCPEIRFEHVSFRYPRTEHEVLKDINITIRPGEHLSVVGLNGAGKTTFIKLLCRLYDVTEGAIYVNDINIREYEYEEYMKLLSVVFQDFKLFSMSIGENIRLGDWEKEAKDLEELCRISGLEEKIRSLPEGLDTLLYKNFSKKGVEPSGGEAQKMAITRAIFKDAPIVVLDEPTAALDPVAEYEIYRQFDRLMGNKTAVYISHRLSSCKFCDRIAVFADNTIAEYGTHEELVKLKDGIYAKMFEAQAQYYV